MFTKTKSREPDFYFINQLPHKMELLLKEQVNQRKDLSIINALLKTLISDIGLQKQVDDYFERDTTSGYNEAPPQSNSEDSAQDGSNNRN